MANLDVTDTGKYTKAIGKRVKHGAHTSSYE